ncbi:hypothetical protein [Spirochaeta africana]|uniref:Uncharacterized protein n=1 Tax=Spirochaeta africana (strain ATCC 700263 / DSM 8902 / Z-7692) TaxID=889378 RepID=H9ULY8_SPIAZ|nr:hypothetical protein [Spirochaeta africana]AFG38531.1 hypothetical protein Spiaf_2500 [Spirochaeta africana DSM 8902]
MKTWGLRRVGENETVYWQNSYLRIWVRRSGKVWRVAHAGHDDESEAQLVQHGRLHGLLGKAIGFILPQRTGSALDEVDLNWQEFIPEEYGDTVGVFPVLPETSVVVRTEVPITLGAGRSLQMYGAIPLWLSVRVVNSTASGKRARGGYANLGVGLLNLPVITLSQTWFGGPMTGRLCHRSDKTLSYTPDIAIDPLAYALCPVKVRNNTRSSVTIGSIAVPTEQIKLYRTIGEEHEVNFWTCPVSAVYTGPEELQLGVLDREPKIEDQLEAWMPPRVSPTDHLFQRGMILLREITNG